MKLPRQPEVILPHQSFFKKLFHIKISEYFILLVNWAEKVLRKLRILFLKLDQLVIGLIQKIREKSQVLTIRYQAWLDQRKIKRVKIKIKMEDQETVDDDKSSDVKTKLSAVSFAESEMEIVTAINRDFKVEEALCIEAITHNPKDAESYRKLGGLYLEQRNYQDAREAFSHILKLKPRDRRAKDILQKIADL